MAGNLVLSKVALKVLMLAVVLAGEKALKLARYLVVRSVVQMVV
jgi:hypothetical protein